jgi:hypothetical protein
MRQSAQAIRRTILAAYAAGVVALVFIPATAAAREPAWASRANEAKAACSAGEVAKGTRLLAKLYATTHDPIWLFNQARCFQRNGEPAQALARFREYLRKTKKARKNSEAASGVAEAEGYVKELEAKIAVEKQKAAPSEPPSPAAVAAEPAPSEPPAAAEVAPPPPPPPTAPAVTTATAAPPSPQGSGQGLLVAGVGLEILGTAVLITGGIFSYLADKTNSDAKNLTADGKVALGSDLRVKQEQGNRYAKSQWIFYGIGGAAVAAGLTLHIIGTRRVGPKAELQPAISPSACGLNLLVRL